MTGGLMQLVGKGAQDQLVNGNPSFTHFRSVYKRHTDFAMEHFRLYFKTTNINLPQAGTLTLRAKIERYAQLLHDCYLNVQLPDIFSPVVPVASPPPSANPNSNALGYEFQWVKNVGYNMINYVAILINGQEIVRHTGEWMKLYAHLKFDGNKKTMLDQMVGNTPDLYDPANAYDRMNQYPHAISTSTTLAAPSIAGRTLTIPLHFWFCESIGSSLPLIALQHSECEFVVELKNMYQLFTVRDVRPASSTYGQRIAPDSSTNIFQIPHFLSPPTFADPTIPTNPTLALWNLNPFMECNYIFLTDQEMAHVAKTDHSFIITQVDAVRREGQYGAGNDIEMTMRNLCTRVVWTSQRNDRNALNDYDNYTNWEDPNKPPLDSTTLLGMTPWYSSGNAQSTSVTNRDILLESSVILDGKERFGYKQTPFFNQLQQYRHHTGRSTDLPGIYSYSFALDHHTTQPSGQLNGSQFNKTILRNTYVQPAYTTSAQAPTVVCILKSTAGNPNPTVVNPNALGTNGKPLYSPSDLVTVVNKANTQTFAYTYITNVYVESYNFLRVLGGVANVVFSS